MNNQVTRAIDSGLSHMRVTDRDLQVIMDSVREGRKVRKKLPAAFVLIAVLILAAVTVLAATGFLDYARTLLQKNFVQETSFQDWPVQDKIELVEQLGHLQYYHDGPGSAPAGLKLQADQDYAVFRLAPGYKSEVV